MKKSLNLIDKEIIRTIHNEQIPLTIGGITKVNKHCIKLEKLNVIQYYNTDTRIKPKII